MKNFIVVLITLVSLSITAFGQDDREYLVTNGTGITVVDVTASPSGRNMWGNNLITKSMTADGDDVIFSIPVTTTDCVWDFKFHDENGAEYVMEKVNLCNTTTFILMKKDKNDKMKK